MKKIKNLFLIIMLFIFNACNSGSSTGPSSTPTESVVTVNLDGISASNFDQNQFISVLAYQLGISDNRITILNVTSRNLSIELYFKDPAEGEPDTTTLLADIVEISTIFMDGIDYSMTAEVNEVATDCAGIPGGTATYDSCGECGGNGLSCGSNSLIDLIQGTWYASSVCIDGNVYNEYIPGCEYYFDCEEINDGTTVQINGYNITLCDGDYPDECSSSQFSLSGNTINSYSYGEPISATFTLSNNNQTLTFVSTYSYGGCTSILTETLQKQSAYTCGSTVELFGQVYNVNSTYYLDFEDNQIISTIPSQIGCLVNLVGLDLENNQLYGSIPPELSNLTNLNYLDLENNNLSGTIPNSVKELILQINSNGGYTSLIENQNLSEIDWINENACGDCNYP